MTPGKRALPHRPHPDHLRKQAKARLAELRLFHADARLADAQQALAQEYGFSSWGRLQAEVSLRAAAERDRRFRVRRRRIPFVDRYRERQIHSAPPEPAAPPEFPTAFFLYGAGTSVGVALVSIIILMSVWALLVGISG